MKKTTLTDTQQKAMDFIEIHIYENGIPPTMAELRDLMGYRAVKSIQDLVKALRQKGAIRVFKKNTARSLVPAKKDN